MNTEIYLIRHGQSEGNLLKRFLGHTDLDLTPFGVLQAKRVGEYLADTHFDALYSSPLKRAASTMREVAKGGMEEVVYIDSLREIYAGKWENRTFSDLEAQYPTPYFTFRRDIGMSCPEEGESTHAVGVRAYETLTHIAEAHPGQRILVTTHATVICMFACEVLGLADEERYRLALPTNASLSIFEYEGGRFKMKCYSQDAYLAELKTPTPPLA